MIDLNDSKRVLRKHGTKYDTVYKATCDSCKLDRGYLPKTRASKLCKPCQGKISHLRVSKITRNKMSLAKKGYVPWNKGKKETRPEVKLKIAIAKIGNVPWNKGTGNYGADDCIKRKVRHLVRRYIKEAPSTLWLETTIGLSQKDLKIYIESKFQPNMTWENWSATGWHLDHIKPLASFNLTNPEEFKVACHHTNLQPLWAKDNLVKSSKI